MYKKNCAICFSSALLCFLLSVIYADTTLAAESKVEAYPYAVKAGVKIGDYRFSVPAGGGVAPIVEVYQSKGRFERMIRDKDINFKTGFRVHCGKKWKLRSDPKIEIYGKHKGVVAENFGVSSANAEYSFMTSKMTSFEQTRSLAPTQACNNVIDDRASAGRPFKSLLKKGFWTKIDQAYEVSLHYRCSATKKKHTFKQPDRSRSLTTWQPLFVHCIGNPDYGKELAKTSKDTNTTTASQADIKKALDKKKKANQSGDKSKRANPIVPVSSELQYRAVVGLGNQSRIVSPPKSLADFLDYGTTMSSVRKMRLVDFETVNINRQRHYIGLWQKGTGTSLLKAPVSVAKFKELHQDNIKKGLRLADFELLKTSNGVRIVSLWQAGGLNEYFSSNMSVKEFKKRNVELKSKGIYPVDMEMFVEAGKVRYAALWRHHDISDNPESEPSLLSAPVQFMPAIAAKKFRKTRDELVAHGKQLVDIERIVKGDKTYFSGLWIDGAGPSSLSKPRNLKAFKKFISSSKAPFIQDLEVY